MKIGSFFLATVSDAIVDREARRLTTTDRLTFLRGLSPEVLARASPLDLPSQTILRIIAEQDEGTLDRLLPAFVGDTSARLAAWRTALEFCSSEAEDTASLDGAAIGAMRAGHAYQTRNGSLWRDFAALMRSHEAIDKDMILSFAEPSGFAAFASKSIATASAFVSRTVRGSRYSSVGGMMYYGFNVRGKGSFLQLHSIEVLARTFSAMAAHGRPQGQDGFQETMVYRETVSHARACGASPERASLDTAAFLDRHERGHLLAHASNARLRRVLDATGTDRAAFYNIDFPTDDDFRAWPRICEGKGSARDVLFLLGDLLANMAILSDIEHESSTFLHLLRAFNFWLLKEPSHLGRPRGVAQFLAHSYRPDLEHFYNGVGHLLQLANASSVALRAEIKCFEREGWDRLLGSVPAGYDNAFRQIAI